MVYIVFVFIGLLFITIGLWTSRALMRTAHDYVNDATTESGRQMRDRTTGSALYNAWISVIVGGAIVVITLYFLVVNTF